MVIGGDFSEMAGSRVYDTGINSWYNATIKGARIKGLSVTHAK